MTLPREVAITEVGPRDGLQNERETIPAAVKLAFIRALVAAGLKRIEVTSFVSPKAVPQLADAADVAAGLPAAPGVTWSALAANDQGLDRLIASGIRRAALFTGASDSFTRKNIGLGVEESLTRFAPLAARAIEAGLTLRGYVSTSFVCPFEGGVKPERVLEVSRRLLDVGCDEVVVSDTIGAAVPEDVRRTVSYLLDSIPAGQISLHFHDTYGTALANVQAGLELGIASFDASAGGLGGCPYAPGATGNLATEDLVYLLERSGVKTGVDLEKLAAAASVIAEALGQPLPGRNWQRLRTARAGSSSTPDRDDARVDQ